MRRVSNLFMALAIFFSMGWAVAGPNMAAASGPTIDVWVQSLDGNEGVPGACLELAPYSNVGCDVNRDGYVWFRDIPSGTYTVAYTSVPPGYRLPLTRDVVVDATVGTILPIEIPVYPENVGSVDVAIRAVDVDTGAALPGACFQLRDYSNVGCDQNGDGQVEFADIPYGEFIIDLVRSPAGSVLSSSGWDDMRLSVDRTPTQYVVRPVYFTEL